MIRRETHAVDQHLTLVKRREIAGLGIAEPDDTEQGVVDGIGDGHRVGELLRSVNAVVVTDRNVGRGCRARNLPGM